MSSRSACRRSATFLLATVIVAAGLSPGDARAGAGAGAPVGSGEVLSIAPVQTRLFGRRATAQLVATGRTADGAVRDQTRAVEWVSLNPEIAQISPQGRVVPKANGAATIVARLGSHEVRTDIKVEGMEIPSPVSFRRDVIPAFSQASCNMGACHGTPTGKGGFRLSLRGYLPDQDFGILSREAGGRRINPIAPETSLILRKPLGEVPHEGGLRLARNSKSYEFLHDWIKEGAKDDPDAPAALSLEILPESRVLNAPANTQQVVVLIHGADNTIRDVTPICYYDSSNPTIAEVDADGYVRFKARGEVAIIAHYLNLVANVRLTHLVEVPGFVRAEVPQDNLIDKAVFEKLNRMRIAPSQPCTDREFIRRVYLDVAGDSAHSGRSRARFWRTRRRRAAISVIDRLLLRPEFYDFWALKFADVLRSNGRLIQTKGAYVFHRWIRECLERNLPMDQLVRELLTSDGSTFKNPAANYYRISRDPETAVETTAQLFLGVRIQCAKCHNHPFERWTQDDYYGFAAFFSQIGRKKGNLPEEEVVFATGSGDVNQPRTGRTMKPKALGGPILDDPVTKDRRIRLASWLASPGNPFFAKSLVNRIWFHLIGRGIVEPVDDFRDSNPSSNDALLEGLTADFVKNGYDLKKLIRSILHSRTYQLGAATNALNADDSLYFSHAQTRLLPAEVLLDAISTVTATTTTFDGLPRGARATQIPDGKMENPFLKTFGRPARELACECERESDSNLSQALQLIGGATVNGKLRDDNGRMAQLAKGGKTTPKKSRASFTWSPLAATPAPPNWPLRPSISPPPKTFGRASRTSGGC